MRSSMNVFFVIFAVVAASGYTPQPPTTISYASVASLYGIPGGKAASIGQNIATNDTRIAQGSDPAQPEQIHLMFRSTSEIVVQWFTGVAQLTNDSSAPFTPPNTKAHATQVRLSAKGMKERQVKGSATFYRMLYNYGPKGPAMAPYFNLSVYGNYTSGVIHRVTLKGLRPSTVYSYVVGDFKKGKVSSPLSFKTLPAPSKREAFKPVTIGFMADLGLSLNASDTVNKLVGNKPDAVVIAGDYSYANVFNDLGAISYNIQDSYQYSQASRWDQLGRLLQPLLSKTPFLGCQGNHEREKQTLQPTKNSFLPWTERFGGNMPFAASKGSPFFYSADVGGVHVVSLSPYVPFGAGSEQMAWLEADLSKMDRAVTPWLVVVFHAPWYVTNIAHYQENECHRQQVEPLLYKYGADFYISGHTHAYERSNKVYNYNVDPCGAVHVVIGNAGIGLNPDFSDSVSYAPTIATASNKTYNISGPCPLPFTPTNPYVWLNTTEICKHSFQPAGNFCPQSQPAFSAMREPSFGYGSIKFENATHALWSYYRNAEHDPLKAADQIWVVRGADKCGARS